MSQEKAAVTLSTKSWHYKLIKAVLGSAAPTPDNMHNLCPYFWLLVFSILTCPLVLPVRAIIWVFLAIEKWTLDFTMNTMVVPAATSWSDRLTDLDVYQIYQHQMDIKKSYAKAFGTYDQYYDKKKLDRNDFVIQWWEKNYGKSPLLNPEDTNPYRKVYTEEFIVWAEEQQKAYEVFCDNEEEKDRIKRQQKLEYSEKISKFRDNTDDFFDRISTAVSSWKNLIKWTKKTLGVIITLAGLFATYFVVNFVGHGILWLVEHWDWKVVMWLSIFIAAVGVVWLITYLMQHWINYMRDKGTDLWYVKIAYTLAMIVFWPFKIILYHFVWQLILVNLWYLIKRGARGLWRSLLGFLGIFGEYFGASYGDYCPGIDWEENKD